MSGIAQRRGADTVQTAGTTARLLPGPPLIAPARSYTFPLAIPGEEDALARGALWIDVHAAGGSFLAQCALGFATAGVAHGLWPVGDRILAVAGGYAYLLDPATPEATVFLPLRPVVSVLAGLPGGRAVLVGYHAVLVLGDGEPWFSPRLSWEGVELTAVEGTLLHGRGWDMTTDEEVDFTLDLNRRTLHGGGYRVASASETA